MSTLLGPSVMVDGSSSNGPSIISGVLSNTKNTYTHIEVLHCDLANIQPVSSFIESLPLINPPSFGFRVNQWQTTTITTTTPKIQTVYECKLIIKLLTFKFIELQDSCDTYLPSKSLSNAGDMGPVFLRKLKCSFVKVCIHFF